MKTRNFNLVADALVAHHKIRQHPEHASDVTVLTVVPLAFPQLTKAALIITADKILEYDLHIDIVMN